MAGNTLRWPDGSTVSSVVVNSAGTYSATVIALNACSAISNNVTIGQDFSIPGGFSVSSVSVCATQQATLQASGCSGGLIQWPTCTTGSTFMTTASHTSVITATCTIGTCSTTASGSVVVGAVLPPPAAILSLTADETGCPVRLIGRATGASFVYTGPANVLPSGYVYSFVYRQSGTYDVVGENVLKSGVYTLTVSNTNACGTSQPVSRTVTVSRNCP
nr:hypothetical protein [uncultured Arsenicibacter sp.]